MELLSESEGVYKYTEYLGQHQSAGEFGQRVRLEYEMPLRCMLTTFYDQMKSRTRGYASLDYELIGFREAKLVKLDRPGERYARGCLQPHRSSGKST